MGPPTARAKGVSNQFAGLVRLSSRKLCLFVEPVIGYGNGIAIVFVQTAVECIRSALGDHVDLCAGRPAGIRAGIYCRHAKLIH